MEGAGDKQTDGDEVTVTVNLTNERAKERNRAVPRQNARPLWFGLGFIIPGMLCIRDGVIQHQKVLRQIRSSPFTATESKPLAKIVALLLLFISLFALISLFQRRVVPLYSLVASLG